MENKEISEFSWSGLFIVTACCSFLFNGAIKFLDGSFSNLLFVIGTAAAFLTIANWAARTVARSSNKKRSKRRFAS